MATSLNPADRIFFSIKAIPSLIRATNRGVRGVQGVGRARLPKDLTTSPEPLISRGHETCYSNTPAEPWARVHPLARPASWANLTTFSAEQTPFAKRFRLFGSLALPVSSNRNRSTTARTSVTDTRQLWIKCRYG